MTNKPKARGTAGESAVCRHLTTAGVDAKRVVLHGAADQGDVHVRTNGGHLIAIEVKSYKGWASARQIEKWLDEADLEGLNADADASALVVKRPGSGPANVGDWLCYIRADEWLWLVLGNRLGPVNPTRAWVSCNLDHLTDVLRAAP
jgi:hypothetical protein